MMKIAALFSALFLGSYVAAQTVSLTPSNLCLLMANGTQIADPNDCTIYYQCIQGSPILYTCQSGTLYNKDFNYCTIPSQSTCASVNTYCQNIDSIAFVADPTSCNGYYYCDGTTEIGLHGNCPSNENFSPYTASCEYAQNYNCGLPSDSGDQATPEENQMCSLIPSGTYFGVSTDCSQWAVCNNGAYSTGSCPDGFEFNTANGDCDYTANVVCQQLGVDNDGNPIPDANSQPSPLGGSCSNPGSYVSDGLTCNGFYWCSSTSQYIWGFCANNQFFDASTSLCVDRSSILCTVGNVCANTIGTIFYWVNDPTNCQKYYYCANNQQSAQSYYCPNGEFFDEVNQVCTDIQPTYAACAGAPIPQTDSPAPVTTTQGAPVPPGPDSTTAAPNNPGAPNGPGGADNTPAPTNTGAPNGPGGADNTPATSNPGAPNVPGGADNTPAPGAPNGPSGADNTPAPGAPNGPGGADNTPAPGAPNGPGGADNTPAPGAPNGPADNTPAPGAPNGPGGADNTPAPNNAGAA